MNEGIRIYDPMESSGAKFTSEEFYDAIQKAIPWAVGVTTAGGHTTAYCPKCKAEVEWRKFPNYCSGCGQRLDWGLLKEGATDK
ncbi:MAG: hypothetical protein LUD19_03310 [Clostridia bacterium]|nr:hypothetical protein [Clostridia bacterium]